MANLDDFIKKQGKKETPFDKPIAKKTPLLRITQSQLSSEENTIIY